MVALPRKSTSETYDAAVDKLRRLQAKLLLTELREQGLEVLAKDGRLLVGPRSLVTEKIVAQVAKARVHLLEVLAGE